MAPSLRIEIFPDNLGATIDFYTKILGFKLVRHEPDLVASPASHGRTTIDKGYAHLVSGSIHIGADASHPAESLAVRQEFRRPPTAVEVVLEFDDLNAIRDQVHQQEWPVKSDEDINLRPWGLRDFRVIDPDGYYIRISEKSIKGDGTGFGGSRLQ